MTWKDLQKAAAALQDGGPGAATVATMREFLQLSREGASRCSALVKDAGAELLRRGGLPESEHWLVTEQVVVAALDCGDVEGAEAALKPLLARFPQSNRVDRLRGMLQEGRGDWAAAEAVYDGILARAPAYEGAHKRKVALLSGQGRLAQAASALVAYLETFQSDLDAWAELADIYSSLGLYRQAAFCLEELLGAAPAVGPWHCWYAAVHATIADAESLKIAQKHYAAAIELSEGTDVRALYGAVAVAGALQRIKGGSSSADGAEIAALSAERLRQLYAARAPTKVPLLSASLLALQEAPRK